MGAELNTTTLAARDVVCASMSSGDTWDALRTFGLQLVSGGGAGTISKTCVAPIERVKVILQVKTSGGAIATVRTIFKEQGVLAFWHRIYNVRRAEDAFHPRGRVRSQLWFATARWFRVWCDSPINHLSHRHCPEAHANGRPAGPAANVFWCGRLRSPNLPQRWCKYILSRIG